MSTWVYDIVKNEQGDVVALNYHIATGEDPTALCLDRRLLGDKEDMVEKELDVFTSPCFDSLEEARQHAWAYRKDRFVGGLD